MNIVIPMAGHGKRFFDRGYTVPKYMIKVQDKTLFEYALLSLPLNLAKNLFFIGLREHQQSFSLTQFIETKIESITKELGLNVNYDVILLDEVTRGQAETVLKAKDYLDLQKDLIIYNIDTFFQSSSLASRLINKYQKYDGIIGAFFLDKQDEKWSFAKLDSHNFVTQTAEKKQISSFALTGFYHFTKAIDFIRIAKNYINNKKQVKGEFYVAPMYNDLIQEGKRFVLDLVDKFIPLGTPEDIEGHISNVN